MANWCECKLKVSGDVANIKRFLLEAFVCSERGLFCLVQEDKNSLTLKLPKKQSDSSFYVNSSNSNFVNSREIKWYFNDPVLTIDNYVAEWCIDPDFINDLSIEYQVKLKVSGYEEMGAFKFDVVADKGSMECELIEFSNFGEFLLDDGFDS